MLRILITDDHDMVSAGIRSWLEAEPDLTVVGEATNGEQALVLVRELQPDVLIQDLKMVGLSGLDVIRRLRAEGNRVRILAITGSGRYHAREAFAAGANGYCAKEEKREVLLAGVRAVARQAHEQTKGHTNESHERYHHTEPWASPIAQEELAETNAAIARVHLTDIELAVLRLLKLPNRDIAEQLFLAEGTVRNHISAVYTKLKVNSRFEAITWAERFGVIASL